MASNFSIRHAAHIVRQGGIIAYPTDTIYGLGCDPYNREAVEKISRIKQRPLSKQLILLASEIEQLRPLIQLSKAQEEMITQSTEPTSWIVTATADAPPWLTADDGSLTIRITQHDEVQKLCSALGHAIISTSANISGKKPAKNSMELHKYFHNRIEKILVYNKQPAGKASRIVRLSDGQIIRH